MPALDTVLLKVASRCNIACDYCYVFELGDSGWARMPKMMSVSTIDTVVNALGDLYEDQGRTFATVLHGGEPLLLEIDRLDQLLRGLRQRLPLSCSISIQTNGTLLSNAILDLCSATSTTLSVSLDGPRDVNDLHRHGHSRESTFDDTLKGIRLLQQHSEADSLFTGVLCVIDPTTDPKEIYSFFRSLKIPSLNFLLCDGNHSKLPVGKASFESTEYGEWLARLWTVYSSDPDPIPIQTLDNIAKLIMGGHASKEGMGTTEYAIAIIETDGSVSKNDTLKSAYDGADRFNTPWSVFTHRLVEIAKSKVFEEYVSTQLPSSSVCKECPQLRVCGGGMPLFRWSDTSGYDNPSVYCNDHKLIISKLRDHIQTEFQCAIP